MTEIFWVRWDKTRGMNQTKFCAICGLEIPRGTYHKQGYGINHSERKEYHCSTHLVCLEIYEFLCDQRKDFHHITETRNEAVKFLLDETGRHDDEMEALTYIHELLLKRKGQQQAEMAKNHWFLKNIFKKIKE